MDIQEVMSVEKFLKIGQQMSAKVPHTHGFGIFFKKSVTHGVTTKWAHIPHIKSTLFF